MDRVPEVGRGSVPPAAAGAGIERLAFLLDDLFRLPGTRFRFGLDALLGLVPGVGDLTGLVLGVPILVSAVRRRLPLRVLLVMLLNGLLDAVIGFVPVAGNVFDFVWKAHRKNLLLLRDPSALPAVLAEARWKLAALVGAVVFLLAFFVAMLFYFFRAMASLYPPLC